MATILFANFPAEGHVNPMRPIASELVARGHEVLWYTGKQFAEKTEASGAVYVPMQEGRDLDDAAVAQLLRARGDLGGVRGLQWDFKHLFIDHAPGYRRDLEALYASRRVDVVVSEAVSLATTVLAPSNAPPAVGIGVFPYAASSRDTAPFGPGLMPSASPLGRVRNHVLGWALRRLVFAPVERHMDEVRRSLGMPPLGERGMLEEILGTYRSYLQATVPEFEYPRSDLAAHVEFIGPLLPAAPKSFSPPAWWSALDGKRPVVLVTQGTIAKDPAQLIMPALEGLAGEPVTVVVTAPGWQGPSNPPSNAFIAGFLPYSELLPRVALVVTNGGYGGVQFALSHGVPLVVAGLTEEKAEINARVAWSGAGIDLRSQTPTPASVRSAVRRVLQDGRFHAHARRIQTAMAGTDAPARAADAIEREARAAAAGTWLARPWGR
jgi:MGT family glycosyltransferase